MAAKIHIVVNPKAGSGKAVKVAHLLLLKLKNNNAYVLNLTFTKEINDAGAITRKAIKNGASMVIAIGGDGTINEVVNGFFIDGTPVNPICELGIINCGTGGGYAGTLNLPHSIEDQIDLLLKPGSQALDLGQITCKGFSGEKVSRLFVNECQIGIGSKVASTVGKKIKILGGTLAFGLAATYLAMMADPLKLSVCFDSEDFKDFSLIGLVVGNGTECAGGMKLTPDAKLNDGYFDVLSINNMNVIQRMLNLSKVYSGRHIFSTHFSIKRCKKIKIRSDSEILLESDGEMIGISPADIEILQSAIRVKTGNFNGLI
jgi:diacylglycerol kinase (ATP)